MPTKIMIEISIIAVTNIKIKFNNNIIITIIPIIKCCSVDGGRRTGEVLPVIVSCKSALS